MNIIKKLINKFFKKNKISLFSDFIIKEISNTIPLEHVDWAIRHGNFDKTGLTGKGERVAILDTGVDSDHKDLKGQVDGFSFISNHISYEDLVGHGTFCCGEIVAKKNENGIIGVAHDATAFCAKVLNGDYRDGSLHNFEEIIANAIKVSIKEGCGVISMSLGTARKSFIIEDAVNEAVDNGILLFAAAGNEGLFGSPYKLYPAAFENVISVAAANSKNMPSWFTTYGIGNNKYEQPEVAIASLEYYWGCLPGNKYGKMIGTSMACPMMAGVALLWREAMRNKGIMPKGKEVLYSFRKWIEKTAKDTNKNGWDSAIGFGVLLLDGDINAE